MAYHEYQEAGKLDVNYNGRAVGQVVTRMLHLRVGTVVGIMKHKWYAMEFRFYGCDTV